MWSLDYTQVKIDSDQEPSPSKSDKTDKYPSTRSTDRPPTMFSETGSECESTKTPIVVNENALNSFFPDNFSPNLEIGHTNSNSNIDSENEQNKQNEQSMSLSVQSVQSESDKLDEKKINPITFYNPNNLSELEDGEKLAQNLEIMNDSNKNNPSGPASSSAAAADLEDFVFIEANQFTEKYENKAILKPG
jgi:hypothetical protein